MAGKRITVVIAQSQGKNPAKRQLEEELAMALILDPDIDVSLVPHLYDLSADHSGTLFLKGVPGDLVVLAWLYPRATRWILDRLGVKGTRTRTKSTTRRSQRLRQSGRSKSPTAGSTASISASNPIPRCTSRNSSGLPARFRSRRSN